MSESKQTKGPCGNQPGDPGYPVPTPYPFDGVPVFPKKAVPQPKESLHACMGLNTCQGYDRLGTNNCAGQGLCSTAVDHNCHVMNDCRNQGGCGLYGTQEELENPGQNGCKSLGSCATPINAERFITTGAKGVRGTSVWLRARKVFQETRYQSYREAHPEKNLTETLPAVGGGKYGDVFKSGPSYLWISENNCERANMTSCGSSGMSGAGGCS